MAGYNDPEGPYTPRAPGVFAHLSHVTDITNKFDKDDAPTEGQIWIYRSANGVFRTETPPSGGVIYLDNYSGTDDQKLTSALSAAAAATYPPTIRLSNRFHQFFTANRVAFEGMRIKGPAGFANPERNAGLPCRVELSFSGPWFTNPLNTDVHQVSLRQLAILGDQGATVLGQNGTGTWYCLQMHDIYASDLDTVLGTQAVGLLMTACSLTGTWEINNTYKGAFHLKGSDNTLWPNGCLIDSPAAYNAAGSANGQYHIWFDYMEKSSIGPIYMTAEGGWNGIRVSGPSNPATAGESNQGGPLSFYGVRIEGRNAGAPCNGALFRIEGGSAILRDSWLAYGMSSPTTPGHSPNDAGVIHQTNGILIVDGCTYDKATSIALSVPFIYVAAGECRVANIMRGSKGGSWSATRPTVNEVTASTVTADSSVTVI